MPKIEDSFKELLGKRNKDTIDSIRTLGWWVGKWESKKLYDGDAIEIGKDGGFKTTGNKNIADGSVWVNLANGNINLK